MIYSLENEHLQVEVNSMGAELWTVYDKQSKKHLLWQGEPDKWPRRSPNLFPICGKLRGGSVSIDGQSYSIPAHGFLRDYDHRLVSQTADKLEFLFEATQDTLKLYPFEFGFAITYMLEGTRLSCTYQVVNKSSRSLPFSVGYHSGFYLGQNAELHFEKPETAKRIAMDSDGLVAINPEDFMDGRQSLQIAAPIFPATVILQGVQSQWVDITSDEHPTVRLGFEGFPYLVLWTNSQPAPFVCVEPWHGLPDPNNASGLLEDKPALVSLEPQQSFCCTQTITLL